MEENTNEQKPRSTLKIVIAIILVLITIFVVVKIIEYQHSISSTTNQGNSDGNTKLFSRSANNGDIFVDGEIDWSNLGVKYIITPQVDINNLRVTICLLDDNKTILTTIEKTLGNVEEGVQVSVSISLLELSLSNIWNTKYESISVSGGTGSYFA